MKFGVTFTAYRRDRSVSGIHSPDNLEPLVSVLSFVWLHIVVIKLLIWNFSDFQIGMSQPPKRALCFKAKTNEKFLVSFPENSPIREQQRGAGSPQELPLRSPCCKVVIMRPGRRL